MSTLAIVLSIFAGFGGVSGLVALFYVIPTYRKLQAEARKAGAEASQVVAQGATILLLPLQSRVQELDVEVNRLRGIIRTLEQTLTLERETSRLEREASQQVIRELRSDVSSRDMRIKILESRGRNGQSA